jgi:hypothetical protein
MTTSNAPDARPGLEAKLPRRDWILLVTLSLATICLLAGSLELGARRMLTSLNTTGEDCLMLNDPSNGARGIPNCVVSEKIPEGNLTEYRFNSSGYRNNFNFGPKSPGTYRIVTVGTSVAAGFRVPEEKTFGVLLPEELSRLTGRKVELYNEGLPWRSPFFISRSFNEALAASPDMILWILTPIDIENTAWVVPHNEARLLSPRARALYRIKTAFATKSFSASMAEIFSHTDAAKLLSDLLYESPSQYVKSSLLGSDYKADFLQSESSSEWQRQIKEFDSSAANIEGQAHKAGVPLVAVLIPDRTQAAMISLMGEWPEGFDPYKLDNELRSIVVRHGGTYIDILPDFRTIPDPQLGYFAVDGHPNANGHATIARLLSKKLVDGAVPGLTASGPQTAGLEPGRQ